jgi:hypothetical protein
LQAEARRIDVAEDRPERLRRHVARRPRHERFDLRAVVKRERRRLVALESAEALGRLRALVEGDEDLRVERRDLAA